MVSHTGGLSLSGRLVFNRQTKYKESDTLYCKEIYFVRIYHKLMSSPIEVPITISKR